MPDHQDLNTVALSGTLTKMPDFAHPWTFCECKVLRGETSVLFIALHVRTDDYLHLLEDLSPGDKLSATGELAYTKAAGLATGGQICVKVKDLRRLDAGGRLGDQATPAAASPAPRPLGHRQNSGDVPRQRGSRPHKPRRRPEGQR